MDVQNDQRFMQTDDPFIADDLYRIENEKNYNIWLHKLVTPFIGKRVLEIGPGIGNISCRLINDEDLLVRIEPNQYCSIVLSKMFSNNPNFMLINKNIEDCELDNLERYSFDTVLFMNVLEHNEDNFAALAFFERILVPGGRVVLFVLAIPLVYSIIDKAVGHFRRYTKSSMKDILCKTALKNEKLFYSNLLGLLGWMYNARIRKLTFQDNSQIWIFNKIVPFISFIESKI